MDVFKNFCAAADREIERRRASTESRMESHYALVEKFKAENESLLEIIRRRALEPPIYDPMQWDYDASGIGGRSNAELGD